MQQQTSSWLLSNYTLHDPAYLHFITMLLHFINITWMTYLEEMD